MGLPIWRDPEEVKIKKEAGTSKPDRTAAARSPIRRRPAQNQQRNNPLRRHPPRLERTPPPPAVGFNGLRESRRTEQRGVPPIQTLLEATDNQPAPSPPTPAAAATESRARSNANIQAIDARERELRANIAQLQDQANRLETEARTITAGLVPDNWEEWEEADREAWLEENGVPSYLYPRAHSSAVDAVTSTSSRLPPRSSRPQSRDGRRQSSLPTPPHDESGNPDSLFIPPDSTEASRPVGTTRRSHPLSHSWRPDSPVNGLGDRNRSPTPPDGWEIMRTTITPDATLPSADSSFTSAAASLSFTSTSTSVTEPDNSNSSVDSQRNAAEDNDNESISSVDPDDLACSDEEREATAAFAEHMYYHEQNSAGGRARIARHRDEWLREGNLYALTDEEEHHEIGFRIIDEALESVEGCERVDEVAQSLPLGAMRNFDNWIFRSRRERSARRERTRGAHITDDEPPSPHPERYGSNVPEAVRIESQQVHDYFRRFTAEEALTAHRGDIDRGSTDAPPRYESLTSQSHPVSPPSTRSEREVGDLLLSDSEQDLDSMRRVVEALARRRDVPDEWWMSMGLNLSRARARSRSRSPAREGRQVTGSPVGGSRVRSGRVERERHASSRL